MQPETNDHEPPRSHDGFDAGALADDLERFPDVLRAACADVPPSSARVRGPNDAWSITEVVAHLADEEELDFPVRLRSTIEDPSRPWTPIDPEGWAEARDYRSRDLRAELERFGHARSGSMRWLRSLLRGDASDWDAAYAHPSGPIRAGDLLVSWAAHDLLHLRQITKRRFELVGARGGRYGTRYAGDWGGV